MLNKEESFRSAIGIMVTVLMEFHCTLDYRQMKGAAVTVNGTNHVLHFYAIHYESNTRDYFHFNTREDR